jgi:hypothetical protein
MVDAGSKSLVLSRSRSSTTEHIFPENCETVCYVAIHSLTDTTGEKTNHNAYPQLYRDELLEGPECTHLNCRVIRTRRGRTRGKDV